MDKQGNKTGGRQKGTLNKASTELREMISNVMPEGWHPVLEMARISAETKDIHLKMAALKEIAPYIAPKLKALDADIGIDGQLIVTIKQYDGKE